MSYPYQNFQAAGGPGYSPPAGGQYATSPPPPQQPWGAASPPPAPSPGWQGGYYPGQGYGPNPGPGPFPTYAAAAAPLAGGAPHQMTLFTPDRSRPLYTVNCPDTMSFSWSKSRNMSVLDAAGGGEIDRAEFHSFTTDKYHFKKKFGTQTGLLLASGKGGEFLWSVENGEMMLTSAAGQGGKAEGPILARFFPREARDLGDATKIAKGRLELRMMGVFLTLVAEMERRRKILLVILCR
ncbi:hypothetical protein V8F33_011778 [Rhypophila sp. PSN 637]